MVDIKITETTRLKLMFYKFTACLWSCDGNFVGLPITLLVSTNLKLFFRDRPTTISGIPENHTVYTKIIYQSKLQ